MTLNMNQIRKLINMKKEQQVGILNFRAGRLEYDSLTKMLTATTKRGKIKFVKSDEGIMHLHWINRISNKRELDVTLFPNTSVWEKVKECTDGRVFVLRMRNSSGRFFFWMQEPTDEKDDEYYEQINKICSGKSITDDGDDKNGTNAAFNPMMAAGGMSGMQGMSPEFLQQQQQIMASLGMGSTSNSSGVNAQQNNLTQLIMNALAGNNTSANGGIGSATSALNALQLQQREAQLEELKNEPDLEDILDPVANEEIAAVLDDEKVMSQLAEYLPAEMNTREDILDQLQSPQFQGCLNRLQSVMNSPQMRSLLAQMGMQPASNSISDNIGVRAFLRAVQNRAAQNQSNVNVRASNEVSNDGNDESSADKEDDNDTEMTDNNNNTESSSK